MHIFQTLYHELVLTNRTFEAQLNAILQQQGIHRSDWSVLYYLILDDQLTSVEIAKLLGIEKPNVTRIMKNLVSIGYARVEPSHEDKRKKRLLITDEGRKMYTEVRTYVDRFEMESMTGIDAEQQQMFIETLNQIQQNLIKRAGDK